MFNEDKLKSFYFFLWFLSLWSLFRVYAKALSCRSFPVVESAILMLYEAKASKPPQILQADINICMLVALNYMSSHLCFLMIILRPFEFLLVNHLQHLGNTSVCSGVMSWKSLLHNLKWSWYRYWFFHIPVYWSPFRGECFPWLCFAITSSLVRSFVFFPHPFPHAASQY